MATGKEKEIEAFGVNITNEGNLIFYKQDNTYVAAFSPKQWNYFIMEDQND
jgi:hypothetical protein